VHQAAAFSPGGDSKIRILISRVSDESVRLPSGQCLIIETNHLCRRMNAMSLRFIFCQVARQFLQLDGCHGDAPCRIFGIRVGGTHGD